MFFSPAVPATAELDGGRGPRGAAGLRHPGAEVRHGFAKRRPTGRMGTGPEFPQKLWKIPWKIYENLEVTVGILTC